MTHKLPMRLSRAALLVVLGVLMPACAAQPWHARTLPACPRSSGHPSLDRERAYVASLMALDTRGYAIVYAEPPQVEAQLTGRAVGWTLRAEPGGAIVIDLGAGAGEPSRKSYTWLGKLEQTVAQYRCRELEWLRWEAQNRGLLPLVAAEEPAAATPSELTVPGAPEDPPPLPPRETFEQVSAARRERIRALEERRAELHLGRAIAGAGVAVGLAVVGYSIMISALTLTNDSCVAAWDGTTGCDHGKLPLRLAMSGLGIHLAGGALMAVTFPRLFSRLSQHRRLGRQIRDERQVELSLGSPGAPLGLSWRSAF